jgi:non-ribosomal peptide synthase protein (TIGR01720 family)
LARSFTGSIISIQIIAKANQAGLQVTAKQLFQYQTIAELAAVTKMRNSAASTQSLVINSAPLTPIQHWFFQQNLPHPQHFNQSVLLSVPPDLQRDRLERAIKQLITHHDALRLRFKCADGVWEQVLGSLDDLIPLRVVDLSGVPLAAQLEQMEVIANETQASLNLSTGPILRVVLFQLGENSPGRMLIVIHHLVVDGVSWRILLSDLVTAYSDEQEHSTLPPKTTSFPDWAVRLSEYAQSDQVLPELNYWLTASRAEITSIPPDYPTEQHSNTFACSDTVTVFLTEAQTQSLLQEVHQAYNTQINDILLTGLAQSFAKFTQKNSLLITLEGHGREEIFTDVDLSRTVGWFTTSFPVNLHWQSSEPSTCIKSIKEQLRSIPCKGIGYGLLRYLCHDSNIRETLAKSVQPAISFNYLGQFTTLQKLPSQSVQWELVEGATGMNHDPSGTRVHLLDITALVVANKLQINIIYSDTIYQRTTVEKLAAAFTTSLQALIEHCTEPKAKGYTPSDFSGARLNQQQLDSFLSKLTKKKSGE